MPEFPGDPENIAFDTPVPDALSRQPRKKERLDLSRQLRMDRELVVAHIFVADDGGPVRTIINGRHHKPTGRHYMIKAGFRSSPWESMEGEYPFMQLSEVATAVHRFLAQPHRLDMQVVGSAKRWVYFPDARIEVDRPFGEMLLNGVPFDQAVAEWRPHMADGATMVVLVEVKTDNDRRADESDYKAKLTLAREVYVTCDRVDASYVMIWDFDRRKSVRMPNVKSRYTQGTSWKVVEAVEAFATAQNIAFHDEDAMIAARAAYNRMIRSQLPIEGFGKARKRAAEIDKAPSLVLGDRVIEKAVPATPDGSANVPHDTAAIHRTDDRIPSIGRDRGKPKREKKPRDSPSEARSSERLVASTSQAPSHPEDYALSDPMDFLRQLAAADQE